MGKCAGRIVEYMAAGSMTQKARGYVTDRPYVPNASILAKPGGRRRNNISGIPCSQLYWRCENPYGRRVSHAAQNRARPSKADPYDRRL